jgi:NAD-dependent DNA ligase
VARVEFSGARFCLTGDFVFAPREKCVVEIEQRGGIVGGNVTKKLRYLVVGGLGSEEWKHGSFGTKIELAIRYRRDGLPILIVHEDRWAASLQ